MAITLGKNYAKIYNTEHPRLTKVFDRGDGPNGSGSGGGAGPANFWAVLPNKRNPKGGIAIPYGPDFAGAVRNTMGRKRGFPDTFVKGGVEN